MELIKEITIIFATAGILGIIAKTFKLPIIVAYLATGLIIGPTGLDLISLNTVNGSTIEGLTNLGITFMLFLIGLELDVKKVKSSGISVLLIALTQITLTWIGGYWISQALGFSPVESIYSALALTFSSTVIAVKILSDNNQLASLHGRILVGILLIQDFFAILTLIFFQGYFNGNIPLDKIYLTLTSVIIFAGCAYLVRRYIIGFVFNLFSHSTELLFVASIAWALFLSLLADRLGFSLAIGALVAGVTLASLPYAQEIRARIRWLRDFFIVLFLSLIGASLVGNLGSNLIVPVFTLTVFVVIGKLLIVLISMAIQGYRPRTSFISGVYLSQISEFSLILITIGLKQNIISNSTGTIIILVAIISIAISSIFISNVDIIFHKCLPLIKYFQRKGHYRDDYQTILENLTDHVVLFGANRVGQPVLERLQKLNHPMVVVDFDPDVIKSLRLDKIPSIYGDMGDPELVDHLNLEKAKMVISTTHDFLDTLTILKKTNTINKKAITLMTATTAPEALILYENDADYVILPHHLSGQYLADIVSDIKDTAPVTSQRLIDQRRKHHIEILTRLSEKNYLV